MIGVVVTTLQVACGAAMAPFQLEYYQLVSVLAIIYR